MGTSGAYGGSSKEAWASSRDRIQEVIGELSSGSADADATAAAIDAVLTAISGDDPAVECPRLSVSVFPSSGATAEGDSSGVGVGGYRLAPSSRGGGRSRRQISRGARLGGRAVGAGYAVRSGDAAALAELGLTLADLAGLTPTQQCIEILNALIGDSGHPDETALRHAIVDVLEMVLGVSDTPDPSSTVRTFISNYIFQLMLVEIGDALSDGSIDEQAAAEFEHQMQGWLEARLELVEIPEDVTFRLPSDFEKAAVIILAEAKNIQEAAAL